MGYIKNIEMKLLVIGTGLLGKKIVETGYERFDIVATYHKEKPKVESELYKLDITDKNSVLNLVEKIKPTVIIHTAALTNVDYCEKNKAKASKVNVEGTKNVAIAAEKIGSKLVYVSTDYVFDGKKGFYKEDDKPNPINYYGLTKLEGERVVEKICNDYLIVRPSVIYGEGRKNFATWIIDELKNSREVKITKEHFASPTLNTDLAEQIFALIEQEKEGIFHTAGRERISRYDFALRIAEIFELDKSLIKPVSAEDLNWIARRPRDSSLDVSRIFKIKRPLDIREGLKKLEAELK